MTTIFPIRDNRILIQANKVIHHTDPKIKNISYNKTHVLKNVNNKTRSMMTFKQPDDVMHLHTVKAFIMNSIANIKYFIFAKGIISQKIADITFNKIKHNILLSIPTLNSSEDNHSKDCKSCIFSFVKDCANAMPNMNNIFENIVLNPVDIIKSNLDGSRFINTINKSAEVVKNILLFHHNIKEFFQKKVYDDVITFERQKSTHNKSDFFEKMKKNFSLVNLLTMPNIDSIFYRLKSNGIKSRHYQKHVSKSNLVFFENKMKNIDWISLDVINKLSSTDFLSQKIFHEAKKIQDKLLDIKLPKKNSIIIDNAHFAFGLHYHTLNCLKLAIPNTYLRNLVLSCFQQDLTSQPCLHVFYNTAEIDKFIPEQSSILYTIDTLKDNQIKLTVTYLGRLIKITDEVTDKNYTNFGARTSIILSEDALPKIKYFNFIK
ncbi:Putative uncharacterized protein Yba3 [Buchnera aphidicola (Takecallis arundicolens)]|uniref:hypothetical protein n=1 Tax=Buchnera aphidicola TaxID=9 RepID=UPI003464CB61